VPDGALVIVTWTGPAGGSIVQLQAGGLGSTLPARSIARATKRWVPTPRPLKTGAAVQAVNDPPSSEHSNVAGSFADSVKDAVVLVVLVGGPETIFVVGAVRSIGHVRDGGVGSTFPARSIDRTFSACAPATSPVRARVAPHATK
jgi:hypothetical protein